MAHTAYIACWSIDRHIVAVVRCSPVVPVAVVEVASFVVVVDFVAVEEYSLAS